MSNQSIHIYAYTVPLPDDVKEAILPGRDDSYSVYLSENLDLESRRQALIHAFIHIVHNDFDEVSINAIENRAERIEKGG